MTRKVIFLYPGQGCQQVGMGFDLYQAYPRARDLFGQADDLLGFSLSRLCFKGPQEELNRDLNAQLAVYTVSCILTDILRGSNVAPDVVSGQSSGFYGAAYAAGCFDFANGFQVVRRAGEILLDENRTLDGSMAVIFGLSVGKVDSLCQQVGDVETAILNTPRQTVISGTQSSVDRAMDLALEAGALDAYKLSVATAYHSRFMKHSSVRFFNEIKAKDLKDPKLPLISYLSLNCVPNKKELINIMAAQLSGPVLWVDLIKILHNDSTGFFLEVGPGMVISRTVRWIDRNIEIMTTTPKASLSKAIERYSAMLTSEQPEDKTSGAKYGCGRQSFI